MTISIQETVAWVNDALAQKDIGAGMTHYRVQNDEIRATNGRITVGHPWDAGGEFLVPGVEFEKVLKRMPGEIEIDVDAKKNVMKLRSGKFRGTIETLPLKEWNYPGVDDSKWLPMPDDLLEKIKALRPFIDDGSTQEWAKCIALQNGFVYATNNIVLAGSPCPAIGDVSVLLPVWAIEFLLERSDGLSEWLWNENHVAFRWDSGAWMRSQLVIGKFPEKAAKMVSDAQNAEPTQDITDTFRDAFKSIAELADDTIAIYADRIESRCGKAEVIAEIECEAPKGGVSLWGAKHVASALAAADSWSPSMWPAPTVFKGEVVAGYVVGRKA